jgi:hypothetical protein
MIKKLALLLTSLVIVSCSNLENAKPASSSAFIYQYGGLGNYRAASVLAVDGGYLVAGDSVGAEGYGGVIIKTDQNGKTLWRKLIKGATISSIQATKNGYLICGDSIQVDLTKLRIIDQKRTKMRLITLDATGKITTDKSFGDFFKMIATDSTARRDFAGSASTIDTKQDIVVTSTISHPNAKPAVNTYTQVSVFDPTTLALKWSRIYNQDNPYDYINGKSVQLTQNGNIIWATSAFAGTSANGVSFLRTLVFESTNREIINDGTFGRNDPTFFYSGNDIKKNGVGFGIIGTYQNSTGAGANILFIRADQSGTVTENSELYFDGVTSASNQPLASKDRTTSTVQDQGITLTSTQDGGFLLAGFTTSTTDGSWGNGGKDVYLIRLDPFGGMLWNKYLGGSGDEVPSSVIQTADGGFVIAGTATLAGQSSIFLMKTNSNGELKN